MSEKEAIDILRAQGHAVGTPDADAGTVRMWVHGNDLVVDVSLGRDLIYLAEGKLTFEELEPAWETTAAG